MIRTSFSSLAVVATMIFAAATVTAGDRVTVNGIVVKTDRFAKEISVQAGEGKPVVLTADSLSRLYLDGKKVVEVDKFRVGAPVRATYEKAKIGNRIVYLRTQSPTKTDVAREVRQALDSARRYSFAEKDKYEDLMRGVIDHVDDRIEELRAQAKDASREARVKLNETIDELKSKRDELENRLERARPAAAEAWETFRSGVTGAAEDLGRAIDRFRSPSK